MSKIRLEPLRQYICDTCGQVIESIEQGYVEWEVTSDEVPAEGKKSWKSRNFHIVHHYLSSPLLDKKEEGCYQSHEASMDLKYFVGEDGIAQMLALLDAGPIFEPVFKGPEVANIREWGELMKRLHIPYYEEARQYFSIAEAEGEFEGMGESLIYTPDFLKRLIQKFSESEELIG